VFDRDVAAKVESLESGGGGDYKTETETDTCGIAAEDCSDGSVSERKLCTCPTKRSKEFQFVGVCDGAKAALIRLAPGQKINNGWHLNDKTSK
jgi:hypothetical protein